MTKLISLCALILTVCCTLAHAEEQKKENDGIIAKARSLVVGFDQSILTSTKFKHQRISAKTTQIGDESWEVSLPAKQALNYFKDHIYDFIGDQAIDVKDDVNGSLEMSSIYMQASFVRLFTIHLYAQDLANGKAILTYSDNLAGQALAAKEATNDAYSTNGLAVFKTIALVSTMPAALVQRGQYRKNIVSATKKCLVSM